MQNVHKYLKANCDILTFSVCEQGDLQLVPGSAKCIVYGSLNGLKID